MAFRVLYGLAIFLFGVSLHKNVLANSCENDNCRAAIDIPIMTKLNAPLKAELDISSLTTQLKELIGNEVKQAVSVAMKDLAENIVDKKAQSALENLQTFLHELEVKMENNYVLLMSKQNIFTNKIHSLTTMDDTLEVKIDQMKEKQTLTELKLSRLESNVQRNSKRVALTAHPSSEGTISNTIIKFDDVKYSVGITNLSSYKNTGKFTVEHEGLYLICASVMSITNNAVYYIKLNGNDISLTHIGQHKEQHAHTGTVTLTRMLNRNDQVWLYAAGSWYLFHDVYSNLSIIKIK